jgi:cyanophycinase
MLDPLRHSRIGLVGSGEFTPAMAEIDREILSSIGPSPTVVVLPTAAAGEDPEDWALRGVEHFWKLGARSVGLMVLERAHAEDPDNVSVIERADLLYISGGKTARLLDALEGSPLWLGFLKARSNGAWLLGSSAGAMALADWSLVHRPEDGHGTPTLWTPGLGMLQGLAVVPHFDRWDEAEHLVAEIAGSCTVFGIDEDTALLLEDGNCRVAGAGTVRVIVDADERTYTAGMTFSLA